MWKLSKVEILIDGDEILFFFQFVCLFLDFMLHFA